MTKSKHGTLSRYCNQACRCKRCRAANTAWMIEYRKRPIPAGALHGSASTYYNHACRCDPCTKAASKSRQESRVRRSALTSN